MLRVARTADGTLVVDRRAPGRGAWLCRVDNSEKIRASCLSLAWRRQGFQRAFRTPVEEHSVDVLREKHAEREKMTEDVASDAT